MCHLLTFFSKLTFSKQSIKNTIRVTNGLDPDQDRRSDGKGYLSQQTTKVPVCDNNFQNSTKRKKVIKIPPKPCNYHKISPFNIKVCLEFLTFFITVGAKYLGSQVQS